jgi:hypothetical protein
MVAIDGYKGWPTLRSALPFLALTMVRPGEVRHMKRNEVLWPSATWRIPAERMKMRRPHDVPLSRQALAILREVWPLTMDDNLVFPSIRSIRRPLSENAFNSVLRRLGYATDEHCAHGFRSSAITILNEHGYDARVIEVALAHRDENKVRAAYNRAQFWPERQKLLQEWAALLDQFRLPTFQARSSYRAFLIPPRRGPLRRSLAVRTSPRRSGIRIEDTEGALQVARAGNLGRACRPKSPCRASFDIEARHVRCR